MANLQRRNTAIAAACCYFVSIIFLILVLIGNTHIKPVLTQIYFFQLDVSDIIPLSVENAQLLNSIARSLGLHDFYQVGLWNFCEGYRNEGITHCSTPVKLYWFNPVEILMSELLSGAKIALPSAVNTILDLLRIGQQTMWGFFLTGTLLNFVLMLGTPLVLKSRGWSFPYAIAAFLSGLCINSAAIIATVLTVGAKYALTAQDQLNIRVNVGVRMFVFMWLAGSLSTVAFILHAAMGCFCLPGRKETAVEGEAEASPASPVVSAEEKKRRFPSFRRRKVAGSA